MISIKNIRKEPPRWYKKFKRIFSNSENFAIGLLLIMGYTAESTLLLVIKLSTSFLLNNLDILLADEDKTD